MVDAASVATPTNTHYEIARSLLEHGKHVLVEKPITDNVRDAEQLVTLARDNHCLLQVGHVERFNPVMRYLNEVLTEAGFIGTGGWPPTAAALGVLVSRIWPAVRREMPDARLAVAGRGTQRLVPSPPAGIHMLGEIPSGADFLSGLGLLLYPIERGSGMKVKVLEALATGVPVVTTPVGAEGVEPNPGVVVAEDDAAIVRAAVSLLRDEAERVERGTAALKTFRTHYMPQVATRPLVEMYAAIAGEA